jgi:hypothetical protein
MLAEPIHSTRDRQVKLLAPAGTRGETGAETPAALGVIRRSSASRTASFTMVTLPVQSYPSRTPDRQPSFGVRSGSLNHPHRLLRQVGMLFRSAVTSSIVGRSSGAWPMHREISCRHAGYRT